MSLILQLPPYCLIFLVVLGLTEIQQWCSVAEMDPSPQRVAKGCCRANLANSRLLPLRSGVRKSMFKVMGETFQQNLLSLQCQPCRVQHKKMDASLGNISNDFLHYFNRQDTESAP